MQEPLVPTDWFLTSDLSYKLRTDKLPFFIGETPLIWLLNYGGLIQMNLEYTSKIEIDLI